MCNCKLCKKTLFSASVPQMDIIKARGSGVTRALIGGCIFIYLCSARRISFEIKFISKEIRRAEHEYMNIHPPN